MIPQTFTNLLKRVLTETDLFNTKLLQYLEKHVGIIEDHISEHHIPMPDDYHLVIDSVPEELEDGFGDLESFYYFVDHKMRSVFHLQPFKAFNLRSWNEAEGCKTLSHIGASRALCMD